MDYIFATHFTVSEITKGNIEKFLFNRLMALLTKKLSY